GYTRGHSHDQYDADYYLRLPRGRAKEIEVPQGEFYATDVFNDYALEFIRQGQKSEKPWFLFLGHSSPHFPVQAPAERADKYDETYGRGWDILRAERFERMQKLGLINGDHWKPTPRAMVPSDRDDIANGFSGKPNPAWNEIDPDRQKDLARRMAVFAAMVESVDQGIGRMVEHLKATGDLENTLILFLSDNGACYEWGPYGFDGVSRRGTTKLYREAELRKIGGPGTHQSYGSGWANLGNTPLRLYKHFTHEGGIATPCIVHWPAGIGLRPDWIRRPAHVMDMMPTLLAAAGAAYPMTLGDTRRLPIEGRNLLPVMRGGKLAERAIGFDHQGARALRRGDWKVVRGKRMPTKATWELYNLSTDRCEVNNVASSHPERVEAMVKEWDTWARRVGVIWDGPQQGGGMNRDGSPTIANQPLSITGKVVAGDKKGVIAAQGGNQHGWAVHLLKGRLAFDVRVKGKVSRIAAPVEAPDQFTFEAGLTAETMTLTLDGRAVAEGPSPGLIPVQPIDALSIGRDDRTAAGDYKAPNPLDGKVRDLKVKSETRGLKTMDKRDEP
ncbi:MAG: sulfatase-like hydrolase/transferase, partial [Verrucomicrobiota bacterium]